MSDGRGPIWHAVYFFTILGSFLLYCIPVVIVVAAIIAAFPVILVAAVVLGVFFLAITIFGS